MSPRLNFVGNQWFRSLSLLNLLSWYLIKKLYSSKLRITISPSLSARQMTIFLVFGSVWQKSRSIFSSFSSFWKVCVLCFLNERFPIRIGPSSLIRKNNRTSLTYQCLAINQLSSNLLRITEHIYRL